MSAINFARDVGETALFSPLALQLRCARLSNLFSLSKESPLGWFVGNHFGSIYALPGLQRFTRSFSYPTFSPLFALGATHAVTGIAYSFFSSPFARNAATGLYWSIVSPFILKPVSPPPIITQVLSEIKSWLASFSSAKKEPSAPPPPISKTLQEAVLIWLGKEELIEREGLLARHALIQANVVASFLAYSVAKQALAKSNHPIIANAAGITALATLSALALPIISSLNDYLFSKDKPLPSENALFCQKALAFVFATYCAPKLLTDSSPLLLAAAQSASFLFFSTFLREVVAL